MLKIVLRLEIFQWNMSTEGHDEFDRSVEIKMETQRKMTETRSQNFTAFYCFFSVFRWYSIYIK